MSPDEISRRLEDAERSLLMERKANEHSRAYQMILERTLKEQLSELGLSADQEKLMIKNTTLESRVVSLNRIIQEKDGELHIAHNKMKRAAETQSLTRQALEAIRKQQDLAMQTIKQLEGKNAGLREQNSKLKRQCDRLESRLEVSEAQLKETMRRLAAKVQNTERHATRDRDRHRKETTQLEMEISRLKDELERARGGFYASGSRGSPPGGVGAAGGAGSTASGNSNAELRVRDYQRQVKNRDKIIVAIKDGYLQECAKSKRLEATVRELRRQLQRPGGASSQENDMLVDRMAAELQRCAKLIKDKDRAIQELQSALGR